MPGRLSSKRTCSILLLVLRRWTTTRLLLRAEAAVEQSLAAVEQQVAVEVQEQTGPLEAFESVAVQSAEEDVVA